MTGLALFPPSSRPENNRCDRSHRLTNWTIWTLPLLGTDCFKSSMPLRSRQHLNPPPLQHWPPSPWPAGASLLPAGRPLDDCGADVVRPATDEPSFET